MKVVRVFALTALLGLLLCVPGGAIERFGAFTNGNADSYLIAITFDDGPHPKYTEQILSILAEYDVPATFFFIGENVEYYPKIAKAVADAGHEIGNHTQKHLHVTELSDCELKQEIETAQNVIRKVTGQSPALFRPPEGKLTEERSAWIREMGLYGVLWNVDTMDWSGVTEEEIIATIMNGTTGGDVILCHDYVCHNSYLPSALRTIIPALIKKGYRFVTVSELMCREGYRVQDSKDVAGGASSVPPSSEGSSSLASTGGCSL